MTIDTLAMLIKQKYGAVKRARGAYLYTASGTRLTDLYLEGGRAILGWRAGSALTVFKNVLSKGAIGSYDTGYWSETERAACALFEDEMGKASGEKAKAMPQGVKRRVFAFSNKAEAFRTACALSEGGTMFWRPWAFIAPLDGEQKPMNIGKADADCIIFQPPFPWGEPLYLLVAKDGMEGLDEIKGERIPSALSAAISRSIYDLKAALPLRGEKDWFTHDKVLNHWWTRRGPYLYPKEELADSALPEYADIGGVYQGAVPECREAVYRGAYDAFVEKCLDCALVISPDYNTPSIISPFLDDGVFKKLVCGYPYRDT